MAYTTGYISSQDQFGRETYSYYDIERERDIVRALERPDVLDPGDTRRNKYDTRSRAQTQPVQRPPGTRGGYNSMIDSYANAMLSEVNAYYDRQEDVMRKTAPKPPDVSGDQASFEEWRGERRAEKLNLGLQRAKAESGVRRSAITAGFQLQKEMMRARVRDGAQASLGKIERNYKEALQNVSREPYVVGKKNIFGIGKGLGSTVWQSKQKEKELQPLVIDEGLLAHSKPTAEWKAVIDASIALVNMWDYNATATNDDYITLSMNYERAVMQWQAAREREQREIPPITMPDLNEADRHLFSGAGGF